MSAGQIDGDAVVPWRKRELRPKTPTERRHYSVGDRYGAGSLAFNQLEPLGFEMGQGLAQLLEFGGRTVHFHPDEVGHL